MRFDVLKNLVSYLNSVFADFQEGDAIDNELIEKVKQAVVKAVEEDFEQIVLSKKDKAKKAIAKILD